MIHDKLSAAARYRGLHPRLDRALELLTPAFLATVGAESMLLEGEDLTVKRFDVQTSDDDSRLYEYHRSYLDIFTVLQGEDRVDLTASEALEPREHRDDYWGGAGRAEQSVVLRPGSFLVLFPGEAHRPGMAADTPQRVSRIVFKIRLKES